MAGIEQSNISFRKPSFDVRTSEIVTGKYYFYKVQPPNHKVPNKPNPCGASDAAIHSAIGLLKVNKNDSQIYITASSTGKEKKPFPESGLPINMNVCGPWLIIREGDDSSIFVTRDYVALPDARL